MGMKDRTKIRKALRKKVDSRLHKLKFVLNVKFILEEKGIPSKGKSFDFLADYILHAPYGLEEC